MEIPAVAVTCTRVADASELARGNGCASAHVLRRAGSDGQQLGSRLDSVGMGLLTILVVWGRAHAIGGCSRRDGWMEWPLGALALASAASGWMRQPAQPAQLRSNCQRLQSAPRKGNQADTGGRLYALRRPWLFFPIARTGRAGAKAQSTLAAAVHGGGARKGDEPCAPPLKDPSKEPKKFRNCSHIPPQRHSNIARANMSKRAADFDGQESEAIKNGDRPMEVDQSDQNGVGEFEDEFEDEFESEDEIMEAGVDGRPDDEREAEERESRPLDPKSTAQT